MRRQRGQELVEFAIVLPVFLLLVLAAFDLMRIVQIANTASDAARQGARQAAANAVSADQPFASYSGSCSGTTFTSSATGSGCLTDAAIMATVKNVLGNAVATGSTPLTYAPSSCPTPSSAGQANVCVYPSQTQRDTEWTASSTTPTDVSVTVVVRYSPMTPMVAGSLPSVFALTYSTTMVPEY